MIFYQANLVVFLAPTPVSALNLRGILLKDFLFIQEAFLLILEELLLLESEFLTILNLNLLVLGGILTSII